MFEHTLAGSTPPGRPVRFGPVSAALLLHAGVLAGLTAVSLLTLRPVPVVPSQPMEFIFHSLPPVEIEASPPAPRARGPAAGSHPALAPPPRPLLPERVPEALPDVEPTSPPAMADTSLNAGDGSEPGTGFLGGDGDGPEGGSGNGPGGEGEGLDEGTGFGPVALGGSVLAPRLLVKVQPDYPPFARKARLEGQVVLRAVVAPDGVVTNVEVIRSTNPVFDDAAIEAVRRWRYSPPKQGGRPVSVWFEVVVKFTLH